MLQNARRIEKVAHIFTVGDLILALLEVRSLFPEIVDATVDGPEGEVFGGFKVIRKRLSDGSEVVDLEFFV